MKIDNSKWLARMHGITEQTYKILKFYTYIRNSLSSMILEQLTYSHAYQLIGWRSTSSYNKNRNAL